MSTSWVIILRGVTADHSQIAAATLRAQDALQLPHGGAVTVEQYVYDEQTRLARLTQLLSLVGSRSRLPSPGQGTIEGEPL